jgi:regulator of sirC expression with transglutaminase-like and TPR domain
LGTGFIVDKSGLIATNAHVISEGRGIDVEVWPNRRLEVLAIEAISREDDLALLRVAVDGTELQPLQLGNGQVIAQGAEVVAFGNPHGLRASVVQGVVSAIREIESNELIQVAMPIEPGNSGGPLLDRQGVVRGIINMKSLQVENVGFAVPISRLVSLMSSTNPIAMERWVRLATMNAEIWRPTMGAHWRERSGIIEVQGEGKGFGGRSLCIHQPQVPGDVFEIAVQVKLDDESGAAGLIFHSDRQDKHYGFYPSDGKLRLTCFLGPSVYSWEIIEEVSSSSYLPGQWNYLKVRVEQERIQCFVNGVSVIETVHSGIRGGAVGLAKFRDTEAKFRKFRLENEIKDDQLSDAGRQWFERFGVLEQLEVLNELESIKLLSSSSDASSRELNRQAERLSRQAARLKRLAEDVRIEPVLQELSTLFDKEDGDDLLRGTLLIAALDHPDLDINAYIRRLDTMAAEILEGLTDEASTDERLAALDEYLFEENGFHGGRDEYYHAANNHLDRVIDDREGMPITLTVLYIELARRLEVSIDGVGLPGHFIGRYTSSDAGEVLIDVFERARRMTADEAAEIVASRLQRLPIEEDFRRQKPIEIATRILHNLIGSAQRSGDIEGLRRYVEGLVALQQDEPEYRLMRGVLRFQTDRYYAAADDFDWLLNQDSRQLDNERIHQMREQVQRAIEAQE